MAHPSTGPIPPEKFREMALAPHGEALREIRKFDPLWGSEGGLDSKPWTVVVRRTIRSEEEATIQVEAPDKDMARKLVYKILEDEADSLKWHDVGEEDEEEADIMSVKERKP